MAWGDAVQAACAAKLSIAPDAPLTEPPPAAFATTRIQITNETTLGAARRLVDAGLRPLALDFANGVQPGGGFLSGSLAQEECLCRFSALYPTLAGDRMYEEHARNSHQHSSDWCILSPDVPVFRDDPGTPLDQPWPLSILTCAAPRAHFSPEFIRNLTGVDPGARTSAALAGFVANCADLLQQRILRVLAVARAYRYDTLVLGAWGCGAFGNDPHRTAADFRHALDNEFSGAFKRQRRFILQPRVGRMQ